MLDIRWQQRLNNYQKALARLQQAVDLSRQRPLSDLEQQGLIQGFEYTHELAWKVMKDYLSDQDGGLQLGGSKDATRLAFSQGMIGQGEVWLQMIDSRNAATHVYEQEIADEVAKAVIDQYAVLLAAFSAEMESRRGS